MDGITKRDKNYILKLLLFQLQRGGVQKIILHKKCQSLKFSPSCHSPLELQLDDLLRRNVIIKYQISVPRTFLPIIGDFQRLLLQIFANFFQTKLISSEIQCNPENSDKKTTA